MRNLRSKRVIEPASGPTTTVGKPPQKVSGKSKNKPSPTVEGGTDREDCCTALVNNNPNGLVYSNGDGLAILPFPSVDSTLQYINGSPTWVNNNQMAAAQKGKS